MSIKTICSRFVAELNGFISVTNTSDLLFFFFFCLSMILLVTVTIVSLIILMYNIVPVTYRVTTGSNIIEVILPVTVTTGSNIINMILPVTVTSVNGISYI